MNLNTYGSLYGKFHQCSVSLVRNDIIVFDLGNSPYEDWSVLRLYPSKNISVDSNKPLLCALKSFFKSDATVSVVSNDKYLWTICLGKERMIYPVSVDVKPETTLHLYATPYYVTNPQIINQHLQGTVRPAYENVYFYKNTILYLDNQDLPYPGGYYFDDRAPTPFYRICFLSDESIDYVSNLAAEWQSRREISTMPFLTRDVTAVPKFIDFNPVPEFSFSEANTISMGLIQRNLSSRKPEHIIQDILISYYKNISRLINDKSGLNLTHLGLIIEWPILLSYEGTRPSKMEGKDRKLVALSINGNHPNQVIHVLHPYDRYVEYNHVPATLWTPISFVYSTLLTDINVKKVVLDTVVVGFVYKEIFFCLAQPLLEGRPTKHPILNGEYLLSVASISDIESDPNIQIIESFRYNDRFSLRRVSLKNISLETWCLTKAEDVHPHPKNIQLPYLVKEWLNFFMEVEPNVFDVDVSTVRLALTLSKHNICYNLTADDHPKDPITVSDGGVKFYLNEKVLQFVNDARVAKSKESTDSSCIIF